MSSYPVKLQQNFPGSSKSERQDPEARTTFVYSGKTKEKNEGQCAGIVRSEQDPE